MRAMKWLLALVCVVMLLAVVPHAHADATDDQYVRIYNVIQEGDSLLSSGQAAQALARFNDARVSLERFQKTYPAWNTKVVAFRLNYLSGKVSELAAAGHVLPATEVPAQRPAVAAQKPDVKSTPSAPAQPSPIRPAPAPAPIPSQPVVAETQDGLKDQLRQLQADKILLEAKLKEALSAMPAASDPRELAKAEERVRSLQKENDLLKVNLDQAKSGRTNRPAGDPLALQKAQKDLAEANRKLSEQTEKANSLTSERNALQAKIRTLEPNAWNAAALDATKKALEEANRQILSQKEAATKLAADKAALQTKLNSMASNIDAASALRAENQMLKKQLADLRSSNPAPGSASASTKQLAEAQAQIAALRSDRELLRLEKMALEDRLRKANGSMFASAANQPQDTARIRDLEKERDDLQKRLEGANKELYGHNSKAVAAKVQDLETQLTILRARLEVFEARQVPYTPEELALFKKPEATVAAVDPNAGKKPLRELPPGSATLVAEADRYFSTKQFDKAEDRYLQVLRKDERNVPTLANLAAIQLEMNHLDEAEKHIKQAVSLAPDDAYSLSILGYLKFRQEKYDDALDALSKAAKLDPQNAQIQNYLGITLSQKGMRGAAETALRKAIQLEPGYASAHHNLAVIYVTQKPPLTELARWHYQKAISAGHPKNPQLEKLFEGQKPAEGTTQKSSDSVSAK
jgi:tetratricopeptide (TPR) repeat protein